MQRQTQDKYAIQISNLYAGGLIAVCLILLQSLIGTNKIDPMTEIAGIAFSIAIPFLTGIVIVNAVEKVHSQNTSKIVVVRIAEVCFVLGILAALVGITLSLWHISTATGISFIIATTIATIINGLYIHGLK